MAAITHVKYGTPGHVMSNGMHHKLEIWYTWAVAPAIATGPPPTGPSLSAGHCKVVLSRRSTLPRVPLCTALSPVCACLTLLCNSLPLLGTPCQQWGRDRKPSQCLGRASIRARGRRRCTTRLGNALGLHLESCPRKWGIGYIILCDVCHPPPQR